MKKSTIAIIALAIVTTLIITSIYVYSNYQSSEIPDTGGTTEGG